MKSPVNFRSLKEIHEEWLNALPKQNKQGNKEQKRGLHFIQQTIVNRGTGYETLKPSKARKMLSQSMLN